MVLDPLIKYNRPDPKIKALWIDQLKPLLIQNRFILQNRAIYDTIKNLLGPHFMDFDLYSDGSFSLSNLDMCVILFKTIENIRKEINVSSILITIHKSNAYFHLYKNKRENYHRDRIDIYSLLKIFEIPKDLWELRIQKAILTLI